MRIILRKADARATNINELADAVEIELPAGTRMKVMMLKDGKEEVAVQINEVINIQVIMGPANAN